jgi:hypothetical protein
LTKHLTPFSPSPKGYSLYTSLKALINNGLLMECCLSLKKLIKKIRQVWKIKVMDLYFLYHANATPVLDWEYFMKE